MYVFMNQAHSVHMQVCERQLNGSVRVCVCVLQTQPLSKGASVHYLTTFTVWWSPRI